MKLYLKPIWSFKALLICSTNILKSLIIVSINGSTDGFTSSQPTALHRLDRRLCTVLMNGSTSSRRMALLCLYKRLYERLYNGSAITRTVAHTIVRTTGSASSIQMALYHLYVVSTNGPASSLRTARSACLQ